MSNFNSVYKAQIYDLSDPAKQGRARLLVPSVLGRSITGWAYPMFPFTDPPKTGEAIWAVFENGDLNRPVWLWTPGNDGVPIGTILEYGGSEVPSADYVFADGGVLEREQYPVLFARYGTTYNTGGETATQFRVPKKTGVVGVGLDTSQTEFNTLGKTGGAKTHTLTVAEMPSHTHIQNTHNHTQNSHNHTQDPHAHSVYDPGHAHTFDGNITAYSGGIAGGIHFGGGTISHYGYGEHIRAASTGVSLYNNTATNQATTATNQATTAINQNTGGGGAHNNLSPYITLNYIIRAR